MKVLILALVLLLSACATIPTVMEGGVCYKEVVGQEKENVYWVPCDKDNTDIGFNRLNCERPPLSGIWLDNTCTFGGIKWEMHDGELGAEPSNDVEI